MNPRVTNICLSFNCDSRLNLIKIKRYNSSISKYNPCQFSGLILRLKISQATVLVFSTGYISISGLKNFKHLINSTFECVNIIRRVNKIRNLNNFKVYNICGAIEVSPIDLTSLAKSFPSFASYETELFPAIIFKFENKIFTIHHSGKIFSTGYKSVDQLNCLFRKFLELISKNGSTKEGQSISMEN